MGTTRTAIKRIGLYPGTFDPITRGHLDIIQRATRLVDKLVIGVAKNSGKGPLFCTSSRVKMVKREIARLPNAAAIEVVPFNNLLVHFAKDLGASVIIRGLRAVSDFEYEIQMASMNYKMYPEVETIYLSSTEGTQFIASSFVKEIARLGGDVRPFVSAEIAADLKEAFKGERARRKIRLVVRD
ncbi:MAG: pantetheine-phosphate adenylyltransferase [Alphaproteobacteria bacterium]|nr:pantetheine-phosphate adenylyltransferase [Alphaproteobacteria bacterium]